MLNPFRGHSKCYNKNKLGKTICQTYCLNTAAAFIVIIVIALIFINEYAPDQKMVPSFPLDDKGAPNMMIYVYLIIGVVLGTLAINGIVYSLHTNVKGNPHVSKHDQKNARLYHKSLQSKPNNGAAYRPRWPLRRPRRNKRQSTLVEGINAAPYYHDQGGRYT